MGVFHYAKNMILAANAWMLRDRGPKILFYHDVVGERAYSYMSTPFELFSSHMSALSEAGIRITEGIPVGENEVMVCFDDGLRGIWDRREYFFSRNMHPTVSLAVDLVGQSDYLTWKEIGELRQAGFHFVSHTWTHRSLTECREDELEHELADSRLELSDRLGGEIKAGYTVGFTSIPGNADTDVMPMRERGMRLLARNLVQSYDVRAFRHVLMGGMNPLCRHYLQLQFEQER